MKRKVIVLDDNIFLDEFMITFVVPELIICLFDRICG